MSLSTIVSWGNTSAERVCRPAGSTITRRATIWKHASFNGSGGNRHARQYGTFSRSQRSTRPDTIGAHVTYSGSAQTINTGSDVLITFDTEDQDDDGMVESRLAGRAGSPAPMDGLYAIAGHVGVTDVRQRRQHRQAESQWDDDLRRDFLGRIKPDAQSGGGVLPDAGRLRVDVLQRTRNTTHATRATNARCSRWCCSPKILDFKRCREASETVNPLAGLTPASER